jgi:hypothetical protein
MSSVSFLTQGRGNQGDNGHAGGMMNRHGGAGMTESQRRINSLAKALENIQGSTVEGGTYCDSLHRRVKHLDSLTSPASDASAILTQASENLASTLSLMKDAREKFDTVSDCAPAITRLQNGARKMCLKAKQKQASRSASKAAGLKSAGAGAASRRNMRASNRQSLKSMTDMNTDNMAANFMPEKNDEVEGSDDEYEDDEDDEDDDNNNMDLWGGGSGNPATDEFSSYTSEQDVYAAADSMEIIRDSFDYFLQHKRWKSTPTTLRDLERVHKEGVDAFCLLVTAHLTAAGPAVRMKAVLGAAQVHQQSRGHRGNSRQPVISHAKETAVATRKRLSDALANRDLMKSVGEYEDFFPLETRAVREMKAVMECLGGDTTVNTSSTRNNDDSLGYGKSGGWGSYLGPKDKRPRPRMELPPNGKVVRTEKVGSGFYSNLTKVRKKYECFRIEREVAVVVHLLRKDCIHASISLILVDFVFLLLSKTCLFRNPS